MWAAISICWGRGEKPGMALASGPSLAKAVSMFMLR